ncbi:unnamed protein product [Effrenium voratum]|uniref:Uncharacterized protein n=1 Tax=Effrenium voratum TaxID=2562239 RepID=A0AA36MHS3_9DINO|nr:unnamed protein product [Effrenium voratum]
MSPRAADAQPEQQSWCTRSRLIPLILGLLCLIAIIVGIAVAVASANHGSGPAPPPLPAGPVRGVAYAPLPCTMDAPCKEKLPSEDVMLPGYAAQWGPKGRNDLEVIQKLGANAVRMYNSLGYDGDHGAFLDRAHSLGLNVMPGIETSLALYNCTNFDCYDTVKKVMKDGFAQGFAKDKQWHPAVHLVVLLNEPDFLVNDPRCPGKAAWCRVKAVLSALDGFLAAEKEAGIQPGRVNLTTTWSFSVADSIDGKCKKCPGYFGFQDMLAVMKDPSLAKYKLKSSAAEVADAFDKRWVNGVNVHDPWSFVKDTIAKNYAPFGNKPWFIGAFGDLSQPHEILKNDVKAMHEYASNSSLFLGATVFEFQTAYFKGGTEMNFGMFGLGKTKIGDADVCDQQGACGKWPVYCLETNLTWVPADQAHRAEAVAAAWGGKVTGLCSSTVSTEPEMRIVV